MEAILKSELSDCLLTFEGPVKPVCFCKGSLKVDPILKVVFIIIIVIKTHEMAPR